MPRKLKDKHIERMTDNFVDDYLQDRPDHPLSDYEMSALAKDKIKEIVDDLESRRDLAPHPTNSKRSKVSGHDDVRTW